MLRYFHLSHCLTLHDDGKQLVPSGRQKESQCSTKFIEYNLGMGIGLNYDKIQN